MGTVPHSCTATMLDRLTSKIDFHGKALSLRADRQQVLSSNLANADTPGYKARDFNFASVLAQQAGEAGKAGLAPAGSTSVLKTDQRHMSGTGVNKESAVSLTTLKYRTADQASLDGNTVNMDVERANFAENSLRYEASLRFINGNVRKILSAIRGE